MVVPVQDCISGNNGTGTRLSLVIPVHVQDSVIGNTSTGKRLYHW